MIRKLSAFLILAFIGWGYLQAQEAKTCFKNMPDSICPLLSAVNRADFIDFLESKMKAEVTNSFGGKSEMTELSPDYIHVKMTPQSSWQMKLLSINDSTKVICVVATVCAPACDSHVKFYTTDWKELVACPTCRHCPFWMILSLRPRIRWMSMKYQDARRQADMLLMKADLSAKDATLAFTFTTTDYMGKEAAEKLKPFVRRPIVYTWNQGKFEKSSTSL